MALRTNSSTGQSDGTLVTTANSGGGGNTAFNAISKGAGSNLVHEAGWYRIDGLTSEAAAAVWGSFATNATYSVSLTFIPPNPAPSATSDIIAMRNSSSAAARIYLNTVNKLQVFNTAGTAVHSFANALPLDGTPVTVSFVVTPGATTGDGVVRAAYYLNYSSTPAEPAFQSTNFNAGTAALNNCQFGKPSNSSWNTTGSGFRIRAIMADDGNTELLLPADPASNVAPTATAGNDLTTVEPWSTVTLVGTDSDSDGTVVDRKWRQISGIPTVVLSGEGAQRTYEAPATLKGAELVFGYMVTDNDGAVSIEDTVSHTILPVTERAVIDGTEVPLRISSVNGS